MSWFGMNKKQFVAEKVGHNLLTLVMDADSCWSDVCKLRSYKTSGPVAVCEMAFARAAIARSCMIEGQIPSVADRLATAALGCLVETFTGQDNEDTLKFYGGPMNERGPSIVANYEENLISTSQWASVLGSRLGVPGVWASEISPMADFQKQRIQDILRKVKIV